MAAKRVTKIARQVRPTALIYCEGAHDLAFVRHLKKIYASKSVSNTHFTARQGGGGAPITLVEDAMRIPGDFDRTMVKMDADRPKAEYKTAETLATGRKITMSYSDPCLDALLLTILKPSSDYSLKGSAYCKKEFEGEFITANKRSSSLLYERFFTRTVLQEARKHIPELDEIIRYFEA